MKKKDTKEITPEEVILDIWIKTFIFKGKRYDSLESAINHMPVEFWTKLSESDRDKVENVLRRFFKRSE